jgi:hypothetical protein
LATLALVGLATRELAALLTLVSVVLLMLVWVAPATKESVGRNMTVLVDQRIEALEVQRTMVLVALLTRG